MGRGDGGIQRHALAHLGAGPHHAPDHRRAGADAEAAAEAPAVALRRNISWMVMPLGNANGSWRMMGPVSSPRSTQCTVTPPSVSPARAIQKSGAGPR